MSREIASMRLTTDELDEICDVTAEAIDRILADDAFGKFAVLSASEESFIQAGNDWQPGSECEAFMRKHDSDPWLLEYRDGASGQLFRAVVQVTLQQVREAFRLYRAGDQEWRRSFQWEPLVL